MKFKKADMIRLSPKAVADYLVMQGWRHERDMEAKAAVWSYREEKGDEYEIILPLSRGLGDFAIRMGEAISTIEEVENRDRWDVYRTLAGIDLLPSEILEGEVAAAEDLEWNPPEKQELETLMEAIDERIVQADRQAIVHLLAEVVESLARGSALIGDDASKASAIWRSCQRILMGAGYPIENDIAPIGFWTVACAGQAELWLNENFRESEERRRAAQTAAEKPDAAQDRETH